VAHRTYFRLASREYPASISIVIPVYNEAEGLPLLRDRLSTFMDRFGSLVELILVNDGSSDQTVDGLHSWAEEDARVSLLNLARNFGHQAAVTAGLDHATGDAIVVMDADLQDPPEVIHQMVAEYCRGYDVVYGKRIARKGETWFKLWSAWAFYRVMRTLIHPDLPEDVGDFRLISRRCLVAITSMRETHRFLRGMLSWSGFPQTAVSYVRDARAAGVTKYPLWKMLTFAWTAAISFSPLPMRLSFGLGVVLAMAGIVQAVNGLVQYALGLYIVPGWTSLMIVICLIGSAILISIGVLGEYVGRIFEESKGRPLYIVADSVNIRSGLPSESYAELEASTKFR